MKKIEDKDQKTQDKEKKQLVKSEPKAPAKTKKEAKKSQVKLPRIFKKQYTEKQLARKILKKIYIVEDKKFIQNLFKETGKNKKGIPLFSIPSDTLVEKKEQTRLKTLAKEIKKQKGRIKLIPLAAAVGTLALIVILFTTFKNRIIKNAIINTCESIFEAKCDIDYVDFRLLDASFKLHHLQIANKDEPMKNLFECDRIVFDFDLNALLKARFVTDEIAVSGMQTNTDRKYSGDISAKIKAKKAAAAAKEDSAFMKTVKARSNAAVDSMKASFQGVFDEYNPVNIINNCYENMQTPAVAKETSDIAKALTEKYKEKPAEVEAQLKAVQEAAQKLSTIDLNAMQKDPKKIAETIKTVQAVKADADKIQKETTAMINDAQKDLNKANALISKIDSSIRADKNMLTGQINKLTSVNISDGKRFISSTLEGAGYQLLGKYYPYAIKGVNYLMQMKNTPKKPKEPTTDDKIKILIAKRSKGRMVYYKANPPKVWIKKITVDGFNFALNLRDISSDMDRTGKPASGEFKITVNEIDHTGTVVVDTRTNTKNPLVLIDYLCDKLPLNIDKSMFGAQDIPGVPSINTNSKFDVALEVFDSDGFNITGTGNFDQMILTAQAFEPEFVSTIYLNTLKNINSMMFQAQCGYTASKGLNLDFKTDVDRQFMNALTKELKAQLTVLAKEAEIKLTEKLNELTGGALGDVHSFEDIYNKLTEYQNKAKEISKQLEKKINDIQNYATNKVNEAVDTATKQAEEKVENAKKQAVENATNMLKNTLKF